jgi:hypothetical protein
VKGTSNLERSVDWAIAALLSGMIVAVIGAVTDRLVDEGLHRVIGKVWLVIFFLMLGKGVWHLLLAVGDLREENAAAGRTNRWYSGWFSTVERRPARWDMYRRHPATLVVFIAASALAVVPLLLWGFRTGR